MQILTVGKSVESSSWEMLHIFTFFPAMRILLMYAGILISTTCNAIWAWDYVALENGNFTPLLHNTF